MFRNCLIMFNSVYSTCMEYVCFVARSTLISNYCVDTLVDAFSIWHVVRFHAFSSDNIRRSIRLFKNVRSPFASPTQVRTCFSQVTALRYWEHIGLAEWRLPKSQRAFFPKDDNLGESMSTVCGCTCEGGQVWVHARRRGVGEKNGTIFFTSWW